MNSFDKQLFVQYVEILNRQEEESLRGQEVHLDSSEERVVESIENSAAKDFDVQDFVDYLKNLSPEKRLEEVEIYFSMLSDTASSKENEEKKEELEFMVSSENSSEEMEKQETKEEDKSKVLVYSKDGYVDVTLFIIVIAFLIVIGILYILFWEI